MVIAQASFPNYFHFPHIQLKYASGLDPILCRALHCPGFAQPHGCPDWHI